MAEVIDKLDFTETLALNMDEETTTPLQGKTEAMILLAYLVFAVFNVTLATKTPYVAVVDHQVVSTETIEFKLVPLSEVEPASSQEQKLVRATTRLKTARTEAAQLLQSLNFFVEESLPSLMAEIEDLRGDDLEENEYERLVEQLKMVKAELAVASGVLKVDLDTYGVPPKVFTPEPTIDELPLREQKALTNVRERDWKALEHSQAETITVIRQCVMKLHGWRVTKEEETSPAIALVARRRATLLNLSN